MYFSYLIIKLDINPLLSPRRAKSDYSQNIELSDFYFQKYTQVYVCNIWKEILSQETI